MTSAADLIGRTFEERYRLDSLIARGGMATVYSAWDLRLARQVAIKVMHPSLAEDPSFVSRFEREARSAAALSHPHVVAVHDAGTDSETGSVFLVMEFVNGQSLREILQSRGALKPNQALGVLDPVLQALDAAHRAGFIHRDIKPENILISDDGRIKVADFGLARAMVDSGSQATRGVLIGTVAYIAPEQVTRGSADERSDLYSLGVMLFELLTGKVPFEADTPIAVAFAHVHNDISAAPLEEVYSPRYLNDFILKLANRNPAVRFGSAAAALNELRKIREQLDGYNPVREVSDFKATTVVQRPTPQPTVAIQNQNADHPTGTQPTVTNLPLKKPKRRMVRLLLVLALLAGSAFGYTKYQSTRTTVPQLVGQTLTDATSELAAVELEIEVSAEVFDNQIPAGVIIQATPESGATIARGSTVSVVLSKGPELYAVPVLIGLTVEEATNAITEAGFKLGTVSEEYSESEKKTVINSDPQTGELLKPGSAISITKSKGPAPVEIPNILGLLETKAKTFLAEAGFTNVTVRREYSDSVGLDKVISITPDVGQKKQTTISIELVISDGPPPVPVPQLVGLTKTEALTKLENVGLSGVVASSNKCPRGTEPRSRIVQQQLTAEGVLLPRGSQVELMIYVFCS